MELNFSAAQVGILLIISLALQPLSLFTFFNLWYITIYYWLVAIAAFEPSLPLSYSASKPGPDEDEANPQIKTLIPRAGSSLAVNFREINRESENFLNWAARDMSESGSEGVEHMSEISIHNWG